MNEVVDGKRIGYGFFLDRPSIDWYLDHYVPRARRREPDVSPLFAEDVSGAPRALIYVADLDPLRDEAIAYAEKLRAAGVDTTLRRFAGLIHGFALMTGLSPAAMAATEEIARAIGHAVARCCHAVASRLVVCANISNLRPV